MDRKYKGEIFSIFMCGLRPGYRRDNRFFIHQRSFQFRAIPDFVWTERTRLAMRSIKWICSDTGKFMIWLSIFSKLFTVLIKPSSMSPVKACCHEDNMGLRRPKSQATLESAGTFFGLLFRKNATRYKKVCGTLLFGWLKCLKLKNGARRKMKDGARRKVMKDSA